MRLTIVLYLESGFCSKEEVYYAASIVNLTASFPKPSLLHHQHETARRTCSRGELPPVPSGLLLLLFPLPLRANQPLLSEAAVQPAGAWSTANQPCPGDTEGTRKGERSPRGSWNLALVCLTLLDAELLARAPRKVTLMGS